MFHNNSERQFYEMEEMPDREIILPRHAEQHDRLDHNFEDANDTLEDARPGACGRGSGDFNETYRDGLNRRSGRSDGNQHTPCKLSIKPETYDGIDDWEDYISHFEICAELGRWTEHEKVLALGMLLKGPARTFYISLTVPERQTYDVLIQRLGKRFGSTRQKKGDYLDQNQEREDNFLISNKGPKGPCSAISTFFWGGVGGLY